MRRVSDAEDSTRTFNRSDATPCIQHLGGWIVPQSRALSRKQESSRRVRDVINRKKNFFYRSPPSRARRRRAPPGDATAPVISGCAFSGVPTRVEPEPGVTTRKVESKNDPENATGLIGVTGETALPKLGPKVSKERPFLLFQFLFVARIARDAPRQSAGTSYRSVDTSRVTRAGRGTRATRTGLP